MVSIKIKVKYILLLLVLITAVFIAKPYIVGKVLLVKAENYHEEENKRMATAYYRKYVQQFPEKEKALDIFSKVLNDMPGSDMFVELIFDSWSSTTLRTLSNQEKLKKLNQDFKLLKKYHDKESLFRLHEKLAKVNYQAGNIDKAVSLLEEYFQSGNITYYWHAGEDLALIYLELGQLQKAEKVIEKMEQNSYGDFDFIFEEVKFYYTMYNRDKEAYFDLKENLKDGDYFRIIPYSFNNISSFEQKDINNLEKHIFGDEEVNLKGKVTKDGKPMGNVFVMLQKKDEKYRLPYTTTGVTHMYDYLTITDENGNYQFRGVEPDEYFLGVSVSYFRIKDYIYKSPVEKSLSGFTGTLKLGGETITKNIKFRPPVKIVKAPEKNKKITEKTTLPLEWEKYPGAEYYKILTGVSYGSRTVYPSNSNKIYETNGKIRITPEKFYTGISMDAKGIDPICVIGYDNLDSSIVYKVIAYNNKGEEISESIDTNDRYQLNWIPDHKLTKADKLLLDRKYKEAIKAYEEAIQKNKNDAYSYKALGRIYANGYQFDENENIIGKDNKKALKYLTKAYQIDQDSSLESYLRSLNWMFGNLEAVDKYLSISLEEYPDNYSILNSKGNLELQLGRLEQAEKYLLAGLQNGDTRYGYIELLPLYILQNRFDDAFDLVEKYPQLEKRYRYAEKFKPCLDDLNIIEVEKFSKELQQGNIDKAIKSLPDTETGNFYRAISYVLLKNGMDDKLYKYYKKQQTPELKAFLKIMGKTHIKSSFPDKNTY
ncbi:MAG: hypothetical protein ACOCRZ_05050 [Halothermotrichaceae bacterium]